MWRRLQQEESQHNCNAKDETSGNPSSWSSRNLQVKDKVSTLLSDVLHAWKGDGTEATASSNPAALASPRTTTSQSTSSSSQEVASNSSGKPKKKKTIVKKKKTTSSSTSTGAAASPTGKKKQLRNRGDCDELSAADIDWCQEELLTRLRNTSTQQSECQELNDSEVFALSIMMKRISRATNHTNNITKAIETLPFKIKDLRPLEIFVLSSQIKQHIKAETESGKFRGSSSSSLSSCLSKSEIDDLKRYTRELLKNRQSN